MAAPSNTNNILRAPDEQMVDNPRELYQFLYLVWHRLGGYTSSVPNLNGLQSSVDELNTLIGVDTRNNNTVQKQLNQKASTSDLKTMAYQDASAVVITGGSLDTVAILDSFINSSTIGNITPLTAAFTDLTVNNKTVFVPSAIQSMVATDAISPSTTLKRVISSTAGSISLSSNPQITAGSDGQFLIVEGSDNTKTVVISNGSGLRLVGGAPFTLSHGSMISFVYDSALALWIELNRH